MDKYETLIQTIAKQTATRFRPASKKSLNSLRTLKFPETAIEFYARYEPEDCAEGQVRLWPIANIVVENTGMVPGICVQPFGYLVFATTMFGDTYCFNLNKVDASGEAEIVLVSHEAASEDSTAEEVHRLAKPVAATLLVFLEQFSKNQVDEECVY